MPENKSGLTLLRSEDWMAVWLGFLIIAAVVVGVRSPLPKFSWATDGEFAATATENKPVVEALIKEAEAKGETDLVAAATALKTALEGNDRKVIGDASKKLAAAGKKAKDKALQKKAADIDRAVGARAGAVVGTVFGGENIWNAIKIGIAFLILSAIGVVLMGGNVVNYTIGFPVVYVLAWLSHVIAGNATMNYWGLEYVIFSLIIGLFIGNVVGVPQWLMEAIKTEYYIKTGLVILGAGILFFEVVQAGVLGIVQALLVVAVIWYICFWLSRKFRVDDEFAVMLSTAVSICGVSAAIAACGAIQGDKKKLSYVTSLVLIVAIPMMVLMPWIAKAFEMPVIVKFSQNVLIGIAAFLISLWWTFKKGAETGERPNAGVIWERFPKFVLGFLIASVVFSFLLDQATVDATKGILGGLRVVWFGLAFTCIGLATRFTDLVSMEGGRPAAAFLLAQAVNVIWTLLLAYLLFGGILFSVPPLQ